MSTYSCGSLGTKSTYMAVPQRAQPKDTNNSSSGGGGGGRVDAMATLIAALLAVGAAIVWGRAGGTPQPSVR
jgi:hypothetical protein